MLAWIFTANDEPVFTNLRASEKLLDALDHATGPYLWRVLLGGEFVKGYDKTIATTITALWGFDATDMLFSFARLCALDVIHIWDAPQAVIDYLETGDESLREAARDAVEMISDEFSWPVAADVAGYALNNRCATISAQRAANALSSADSSVHWTVVSARLTRRLAEMVKNRPQTQQSV